MNSKNRIVYIIMDGWGYREETEGNGIALANTPNFDKFWQEKPHALLDAAGEAVGLPPGQMGTSEVNHMTIGAGRVIYQDLVKINKSIESGELAQNHKIIEAMEYVKKNNSTLHLKGIIGDGGVHSYQTHLHALLDIAKKMEVPRVLVHIFTDGRDTLPQSAKKYIEELENHMKKVGVGKIASISGRYYAMDRDNKWDRTNAAFEMLTKGTNVKYKSALEAIEASYNEGITDEFIKPVLIEIEEGESQCIGSNDAVIFVNFRTDRAKQLAKKFQESKIKNLKYTTMTQYSEDLDFDIVFPQDTIKNTLGEILAQNGVKQLRITETEKANHLTYFFNARKMQALEGEDRITLDSYDVATHDERPEMRTPDITREIIQAMKGKTHQVIITNICNGDMVGHTAKVGPVKTAIETVDKSIGEITEVAQKEDYDVIISADHGNAEELIDLESGTEKTSHTTNPVPFILISSEYQKLKKDHASLTAVAPTILKMLDIKKPAEMTGESLV